MNTGQVATRKGDRAVPLPWGSRGLTSGASRSSLLLGSAVHTRRFWGCAICPRILQISQAEGHPSSSHSRTPKCLSVPPSKIMQDPGPGLLSTSTPRCSCASPRRLLLGHGSGRPVSISRCQAQGGSLFPGSGHPSAQAAQGSALPLGSRSSAWSPISPPALPTPCHPLSHTVPPAIPPALSVVCGPAVLSARKALARVPLCRCP